MHSKSTQIDCYGVVLKIKLNIYFCDFCKAQTRRKWHQNMDEYGWI